MPDDHIALHPANLFKQPDGPVSGAFDDTYLHSRASRSITRKSPFHFVTQLTFINHSGKSQALGCASLLEHKVALCCIYRPEFRDMEEQLSRIMVRTAGVCATPYWFDFRLTLTSGKRIAIAVKPERESSTYAFRQKMEAIRNIAVPEIADHVHIISERNIDPVRLARAKLFHAARFPDPQLDMYVRSELIGLERPQSIKIFLAKTSLGGEGWWSVVRAIRAGVINVAAHEAITDRSVISLPGDV
ncbi:hypothetical protein ABEB22_14465 (plasmid) [Thioclava sp. 'Guangxiensis']|uniref:hypothetical protein n=1 Tax=Thioclava sp. 'Guangxiensis' TaxID=3149044 RepID=UPI0032C49A43